AVNQRQPPVLVRDVSVQCTSTHEEHLSNGYEKETKLTRAKSSDYLLDTNRVHDQNNERQRCVSMTSSMTDDSYENLSTVTQNSNSRRRISHLLHRRQMSSNNLLNRLEYYSVPYYQYAGRRYGSKEIGIQVNLNDSKLVSPYQLLNDFSLHKNENDNVKQYSVTIIVPVKNRHLLFGLHQTNQEQGIDVKILPNMQSKHTTVRYMNTKEYVTIKRTIQGQVVG
ncbi:unnamed protein product, partial [Didymodactylos carnosus]